MPSPRISLDQGPPLPPNLQPSPQATMSGLAGQQSQAVAPSGSAALAKSVAEKGMFVEQALNDIAQILPDTAASLGDLISRMRSVVGQALAKGAQPPSPTPGAFAGPPMPMGMPGA